MLYHMPQTAAKLLHTGTCSVFCITSSVYEQHCCSYTDWLTQALTAKYAREEDQVAEDDMGKVSPLHAGHLVIVVCEVWIVQSVHTVSAVRPGDRPRHRRHPACFAAVDTATATAAAVLTALPAVEGLGNVKRDLINQ
jgi:hypothetical protein